MVGALALLYLIVELQILNSLLGLWVIIFAGPPMHSSLSTFIVHHPTYMPNMGSNPWGNPVYFGEYVLKPSRQLSDPPPESGAEL